MKALDKNLEQVLREGRDARGYYSSRELTVQDLRSFRLQQSQRVSAMANYFAMANPIMPLAFLGAFFMLGKMDDSYQGPYERQLAEYQRAQQTQALYLCALKQKQEAERKPFSVCSSRAIDGIIGPGREMPMPVERKAKKENSLLFEGKRSEQIAGPRLLARPQSEASKLVKAKSVLESESDKLGKQQDYHSVCRVSSRIDMIDKALKRMGC
jgi:hypothetical protein